MSFWVVQPPFVHLRRAVFLFQLVRSFSTRCLIRLVDDLALVLLSILLSEISVFLMNMSSVFFSKCLVNFQTYSLVSC